MNGWKCGDTLERCENAAMAEAAPAWTCGDGCFRSDQNSRAASRASSRSRLSGLQVKLAMVTAAADNRPGWLPDKNQTKRVRTSWLPRASKLTSSVPRIDNVLTIGSRTWNHHHNLRLIDDTITKCWCLHPRWVDSNGLWTSRRRRGAGSGRKLRRSSKASIWLPPRLSAERCCALPSTPIVGSVSAPAPTFRVRSTGLDISGWFPYLQTVSFLRLFD